MTDKEKKHPAILNHYSGIVIIPEGKYGATLSGANFRNANLNSANLSGVNFRNANLIDANFRNANLSHANLSHANLSGAENLPIAAAWLEANFEHDDKGYIVYKTFAMNFTPPEHWKRKVGSFITEVVNPLPTLTCACGINFATIKWIKDNSDSDPTIIWKCRLNWKDLADCVVPYNTDGKAGCGRLELLEILEA